LAGLLLASPPAGRRAVRRLLFGAYSDRYAAMTLTIWRMALGSGMIGWLPTSAESCVTRRSCWWRLV
jgi:hypothetical protein